MPAPKTVEQLEAALKEAEPILKEAADQAEKHAAHRTQLEQLAPAIVDSLIKAGELDATMREQAIKNVLDDPVKVASALKSVTLKLAEAREGIPPAALGAGVADPGRGTSKSANDRTGKSKADVAFEEALGL